MRCPYCQGPVVGSNQVVIVVGAGPAHSHCHERALVGQRIFEGLHLPSLSLERLLELSEMVQVELNSRNKMDVVELFA